MGAVASQITSFSIVCSTVRSGAGQRKHYSSASLAFGRGIHWWPVNSPHKGPVTLLCFHFMTSSWQWEKSKPILHDFETRRSLAARGCIGKWVATQTNKRHISHRNETSKTNLITFRWSLRYVSLAHIYAKQGWANSYFFLLGLGHDLSRDRVNLPPRNCTQFSCFVMLFCCSIWIEFNSIISLTTLYSLSGFSSAL